MLWMGFKRHPLCPMCKSIKEMTISETDDGIRYWVCKDCKRRYEIRERD